MSKDKDEFTWKYLPHAKLQDIVSDGRSILTLWLIVSGIILLLGLFFNVGANTLESEESTSWYDILPNWVWYGIIFSVIAWSARGEKYNFTSPTLGFKSWLFLSIFMTVIFASFEYFPWWISTPIFFGAVLFIQFLDGLALKGKANFESASGIDQERS